MATFGKTTIGATTSEFTRGYAGGCKFTLGEDGTIFEIKAHIFIYGGNIKAGIYDDQNGRPNNLMGASDAVYVRSTVYDWVTFTFSQPISLSAGTYWLCLLAETQDIYYSYDAGDVNQTAYHANAYPDFLNPWGTSIIYINRAISIYATYTPVGIGTGTVFGTITDSKTGAPISGANITVNSYIGTSDVNGNYMIPNIIEGAYTAIVTAPGYESQSQPVAVVTGETTIANFALVLITKIIIHNCDSVEGWNGIFGDGVTLVPLSISSDRVEGLGSLLADIISTPGNRFAEVYIGTGTAGWLLDWRQFPLLNFALKVSDLTYPISVTIFSGPAWVETHYQLSGYIANAWTYFIIDLTRLGTDGTPPPDLTSVQRLRFDIVTEPGLHRTLQIDDVYRSLAEEISRIISGVTTDFKTTNPIANVSITANGYGPVQTAIDGTFQLNVTAGQFTLTFSHPEYQTKTVIVDTTIANVTNLNVALSPKILPTLLHAEGRFIKDAYDNIVYLRGVNAGGWVDVTCGGYIGQSYCTWDPAIIKANLDAMKRWGINCARTLLVCDWWKNNAQNYRQNIKDFITWAAERGIYVLIGFYQVQHYGGTQDWTNFPYPPYIDSTGAQTIPNEQAFIDIWASVAQELGGFQNILFEFWNEVGANYAPNSPEMQHWWTVAQSCIDAVRQYSDALIDIGYGWGIHYDFDGGRSTLDWILTCPLTDPIGQTKFGHPNLAYNTHIYRSGGGLGYWSSTGQQAILRQDIETAWKGCYVDAVGEQWNKPLIIGEIGASVNRGSEEITANANALAIANDWGLHYLAWIWLTTNVTGFGLVTAEGYPAFPPSTWGVALQNALAAQAALIPDPDGPYTATTDNPTIQFTGSATGGKAPYTWFWDFGDGTTSNLQNPTHTYPTIAQTYNVKLTVTDSSVPALQVTTQTTATIMPTYTLTVSTTTGGTTNPSSGSYSYASGTVVQVTALPDVNYRFVQWGLDGVPRTENPISVVMDADHTLKAVFEYVPPPPLIATIQGYIKDAQTDTPILGATVTCDGYADITEIDGAYAFVDIPAKSYTLTVTMTGYQPLSMGVDASTGGTYPIDLELTPVTPPCFIATVSYGSPLARELNVLRRFRDRCLPSQVTAAYYMVGPFLAQFIKRRNAIKRYVREVLNLIVEMVEWVK